MELHNLLENNDIWNVNTRVKSGEYTTGLQLLYFSINNIKCCQGGYMKETDILRVKELYIEGRSCREIGDWFGVSRSYIHKIIKTRFPEIQLTDKDKRNRIKVGMLNSPVLEETRNTNVRKKMGKYIFIRINRTDWMPEHRYVMEQYLGRKLDKREQVHHRNCIKDDNRLENLELILVNQCHKGEVCCPYCQTLFSLK
jgi:hypothetical protein